MLISYNWLKNYIKTDLAVDKIAEILTFIGLEVEEVCEYEETKGNLEGVIIGHIKSKEKHPNADKLSLVTVDIGEEDLLKIVCGAPNVDVNQKVFVATIGTILHSQSKEFKIEKSKIRGELSQGMICSEEELSISATSNGILVLPEDAIIGMPANKYLSLYSDVILSIGLTPNRIDAASHIGVARDLIAYLKSIGENITLQKPEIEEIKVSENRLKISVDIENTDACKRYSGVVMKDVKIDNSPKWLQNYLKALGLKPINNIVDITNFVLLECGQPLHAFDYNKIVENKIIVKTLNNRQKFTTLDGIQREIDENDLMICNGQEPMCIAGIFGGLESGIIAETKDIFLESAYFSPSFIYKTSKRLGITTDSSYRFERGTDINNVIFALKRAINLIENIAGGVIASEIVDIYHKKQENHKIEISVSKINKLIGNDLPKEKIKNILIALEFNILQDSDDLMIIEVPSYKVDVKNLPDVVEEIARIYGYDNIVIPNKINSSLSFFNQIDKKEQLINKVSEMLSNNGFNEIMLNSLTKSEYYQSDDLVKIINPLSNDLNVLRKSLIFGGLETIKRNINYQSKNLKLFEFGKCYYKIGEKNILDNYQENQYLSIFITGNKEDINWKEKPSRSDYFDIKSSVCKVLNSIGLKLNNFEEIEQEEYFDIGMKWGSAVKFGKIKDNLLQLFDIEQDIFYAEINWDIIMDLLKNIEPNKYKPLQKFPEVKRDLSLLIGNDVKFAEIKSKILNLKEKKIKNILLFDVYQGKELVENSKSYSITIVLLDENKTMQDKEIDRVMSKIIDMLEKEPNIKIRK